jgi:hypothetical protein
MPSTPSASTPPAHMYLLVVLEHDNPAAEDLPARRREISKQQSISKSQVKQSKKLAMF